MNKEELKEKYESREIEPVIMLSTYCTACYPKKRQTFYIYSGNSLCAECFEKATTTIKNGKPTSHP